MPNLASQEKRDRQNERRRLRNKTVRSTVRTSMKKFGRAVDAGDHGAAQVAYRAAARDLDRAVSKGVLHRNHAANKKSQMARQLASMS
jgi:small subunit ribosomal protein S20